MDVSKPHSHLLINRYLNCFNFLVHTSNELMLIKIYSYIIRPNDIGS